MLNIKALALLLASLPPHHEDRDETAEARLARSHITADAVVFATEMHTCSGRFEADDCKPAWHGEPSGLALIGVTHGEFESHYLARIQAGNCKPLECDRGRARGYWQPQRSTLLARQWWPYMRGLAPENVRASAIVGLGHLAFMSCRGNVVHMFQAQDGRGCRDGKRGHVRAARLRELTARYHAIVAELRADNDAQEPAA